ncbi:MAG: GbsR/MarR family transcriptional regulator [Bacteroidia bacterium]
MDDLSKQREELIELFGIHFENIGHLPPLGSRILAMLIIDACSRPYTFEDLVEQMGASKSSISTNLNLLLKMGKITYYTLPGDRKKYYRPSEFSERFDNYLKMIAFEKGIMDKMVDYRKKTVSSQSEKFELEKSEAYKEHILEMEALLNKTIEKFRRIEKEGK